MKFEEFNLDEKLIQGLKDAGYYECMPVQEQTLKHTINRKDVEVQSQTGTGKTAAFLITVLQFFQKEGKNRKTLIVVPTRELAVQIEEEAKLLSRYIDINIVSIFGGTGYRKQENLIEQGADIIIGTPGRLIDFGKSGKIKFSDIGTLIIDEADRMFDMGFIPDLRWMMRRMPKREERMTMLFSATLNTRVRQLAWEYMNDPVEIEIAPESLTVDEIEQVLYHVSKEEKIKLLIGILKKEDPATAIIFLNTKHQALELSKRLTHNGMKSSCLMGDMPQKKRLSIIDRMKSGEIKLLVATDVAARGLHINDLEMVINYDLPEDCENYVHRIGRTARAGKTGKAVSLACEKYVMALPAIEEYIKMKIPVEWADDGLFAEDLSEGMNFSQERKRYTERKGSREYGRRGTSKGSYSGGRRKETDFKKSSRQTVNNERKRNDRFEERKTASDISEKNSATDKRRDSRKSKGIEGKTGHSAVGKKTYESRDSRKNYSRKKGKSYEDRIRYYNEKYGENIKSPEKPMQEKTERDNEKKKSFFKRLFGG